MSGIAALWNVPGDIDETNEWSFSHQANHRDIARILRDSYNLVLPEFPFDPIPLDDPQSWTYQHQIIHNYLSQALETSNLNLLNVDWKNASSLGNFVQANATLHVEICDLLGIG